jgi:hypothetical protein
MVGARINRAPGLAWGSGVKGLNDFHTPDCNNTLWHRDDSRHCLAMGTSGGIDDTIENGGPKVAVNVKSTVCESAPSFALQAIH